MGEKYPEKLERKLRRSRRDGTIPPRQNAPPARYTYVINEKGEIHYTAMEHKKYLWPESHVTDYRAAFVDDGSTDTVFNNPLADGQKGFDGNIWHKLKE